MAKVKFSKHALEERADRIAYIATTIGFGEIIFQEWDDRYQNYQCLTDTGVIIAKASDDTIITMFIATYDQAHRLMKGKVPTAVKNKILKNMKRNRTTQQNERGK